MEKWNSTEVLAGITTFMAMAYIAFVNPAILQPLGMAPGAVFLWTCLTAAAASFFAARYVNLPTALACSMGLNTFTANFARINHVSWPNLLCICGVVSIIILTLSFTTYRIELINSVPPQIFAAIKAGIGAMLANVAINELTLFASDAGPLPALVLFTIGIGIVIGGKLWLANIDKAGSSRAYWYAETLNSSSLFLSILVLFPLAWVFYPPVKFDPGKSPIMWVWMQPDNPWKHITGQATVGTSSVYAIAVFFIMIMDIAGSTVYFLESRKYADTPGQSKRADLVAKGFIVDSLSNVVATLAGVTPLVYYVENHAGWEAGGKSGISTVVVSLGFFAMAIFGGVCMWFRLPFTEFIPRVIVTPTLFYVGLTMIAESFVVPSTVAVEADMQISLPLVNLAASQQAAPGQVFYLLPAAITTVFATKTSLDVAIAAGITAYMVISLFPESYLGVEQVKGRKINTIYIAALFVLALNLFIAFA